MKGILTNKGYKIITNVLWVVALLGMIGLYIATKQLSSEVKELKSITNRK